MHAVIDKKKRFKHLRKVLMNILLLSLELQQMLLIKRNAFFFLVWCLAFSVDNNQVMFQMKEDTNGVTAALVAEKTGESISPFIHLFGFPIMNSC